MTNFINKLFNWKKKNKPVPIQSYYPHWAARDGSLPLSLVDKLNHNTIVGIHHAMKIDEINSLLQHKNNFSIAWYVESNTNEMNDEAFSRPISTRILEARNKQNKLEMTYSADRFSNLIELDAAREKYEGKLFGAQNTKNSWLMDADLVNKCDFKYLAKSPTLEQVEKLQSKFGKDFVPRIVYEDVTASPPDDYSKEACKLIQRGVISTLIMHSGAYDGFGKTTENEANNFVTKQYNYDNVEVYYGLHHSFKKLKSFPLR